MRSQEPKAKSQKSKPANKNGQSFTNAGRQKSWMIIGWPAGRKAKCAEGTSICSPLILIRVAIFGVLQVAVLHLAVSMATRPLPFAQATSRPLQASSESQHRWLRVAFMRWARSLFMDFCTDSVLLSLAGPGMTKAFGKRSTRQGRSGSCGTWDFFSIQRHLQPGPSPPDALDEELLKGLVLLQGPRLLPLRGLALRLQPLSSLCGAPPFVPPESWSRSSWHGGSSSLLAAEAIPLTQRQG